MLKPTQIQRLMFLFAIAGLFAVTADFACLEDVCAELRKGEFRTMDDIEQQRVQTLKDALADQGITLSPDQQKTLGRDGKLFGVVKLERPVKHPNGEVEMPRGWLSDIPEGHPWRKRLTPGDDAYYSFIEERLFKARLYDPANPEHRKAAEAYLDKVSSDDPRFVGWTYAVRTECPKKKLDAPGTGTKDAEPDGE